MSEALTLKQRFQLSRFIKGEPAALDAVTLSHRRIFILPTRRGLVFLLFIGLMVLLAFVYNNNLAYLLSFLMVSVFVVSILHSFKALAGLQLSCGKQTPVFAGDMAAFSIRISNPGRYRRYNLHLIAEQTEPVQTDLEAKATTTLALMKSVRRRGWHSLGTVTVYSFFPLGLARAWSPLNFQSQLLVYPKPADTALPFPESFSLKQKQGRSQSGNDEFYQCQDYQTGDPIRQIHWKALAKHRELLTKKYDGEGSAEIWLDLAAAPGHDLEQKLSQLCRWVNDAASAGLHYGLRLPGSNISPDHSRGHKHKCLERLALY